MKTEKELTNLINETTENYKAGKISKKELLTKQMDYIEQALKNPNIKKSKKRTLKQGLNLMKVTFKFL